MRCCTRHQRWCHPLQWLVLSWSNVTSCHTAGHRSNKDRDCCTTARYSLPSVAVAWHTSTYFTQSHSQVTDSHEMLFINLYGGTRQQQYQQWKKQRQTVITVYATLAFIQSAYYNWQMCELEKKSTKWTAQRITKTGISQLKSNVKNRRNMQLLTTVCAMLVAMWFIMWCMLSLSIVLSQD